MANLSQLQMPSIDTGQLSGKDGKKIKSYLFQIQEMLRYALNDIDEDNLSEELRSKIESGGLRTWSHRRKITGKNTLRLRLPAKSAARCQSPSSYCAHTANRLPSGSHSRICSRLV